MSKRAVRSAGAALAAAVAAGLAACTTSAVGQPVPAQQSVTAPAATAGASASPTPGASPSTASPAGAPTMAGDAATNAACALVSAQEITQLAGYPVTGLKGVTGPGSWNNTLSDCVWFVDAPDIGSPSVSVQYSVVRPDLIKPLEDYLRQTIQQGFGTAVPGVGDVTRLDKHAVDTMQGTAVVSVSVLLHAEATPQDQDKAVQVTKLVLTRVAR